MKFRHFAAALIGICAWWFLFFVVGITFGLVWPAYREAAGAMFNADDMSLFTTPMLLLNWVLFTINGVVVGMLITRIARIRIPALIVALLLLIYAVIEHYFVVWDDFPHWYNLIVPVVITMTIVVGSRLTAPHTAHA